MAWNDKIKQLRKKLGMNQKEFGELFDVKQRTVSAWEAGINEPPLSVLLKIFELYGITPNSLLLGSDDDLNYLLTRVHAIAKNENKEQDLIDHLNSFIQNYHYEKLNSLVRSFKGGDVAKKLAEAWSGKGERMLIVLYYFIEFLENHKPEKNDKNALISLLQNFKLPKKIITKHLFTISQKDRDNLVKWVDDNIDELDAATILSDLPGTKDFIKQELNYLNRHLV